MITDKQELQRLCDAAKLHDVYCDGYHALPRAVKRHLSLHDMQEIWHCMVKPTLEALLAELALKAQEQQPALAKYQPCGCVICDCEDDHRCHGCGAKHCGTHPVQEIPNPVYVEQEQPENERLRKDAERYRWLRSVASLTEAQRIVNDSPEGMDATIDAAMEKENKP